MAGVIQQSVEIFRACGPVGWPLALLSVVSFGLCLERAIYFASLKRAMRPERIRAVAQALRTSNETALARESHDDALGRFVGALLDGSSQSPIAESTVMAAAESVRPGIERYLQFLTTAITAGPMLGILGTVTGIIKSFGLLGSTDRVADTASMAVGISEALYTTVFGLVIALGVLFPYNHFRRSADRALGMLETVGAAAIESSRNRSG